MVKNAIGGVFIQRYDTAVEVEYQVACCDWTDGDALGEGTMFSMDVGRDGGRMEEFVDGIGALYGVVGEDVVDAGVGFFIIVGIKFMVVVVMVEFADGFVGGSEEGKVVRGGTVEQGRKMIVVADEVGDDGSIRVGEDEVVEGLIGCGMAEIWGWSGMAEGRSEFGDVLGVGMG